LVWPEEGLWRKPMTDGGSHDVNNVVGVVLLLQGDFEV
jgi:hypothetical protein